MVRLKDFDEYEDAELLRQKIAACFVGFYRDLEAQGDDFEEKSGFPSEMTPGSILKAPAGQTIEFSNPPSSEGYQGYAEHTKMTIAIGCGVPYMLLSGDYSKVNYSSARMAQLNFMRHIDQIQRHLLIPQMCDPIFSWFADTCELIGVQGAVHAKWVPPKKDLVDQMKEFEAYKTAVQAGFMSHAQVVRELGEDPEDVYRDIETTKKYLHDKGLSFEQ
jgi:lambda family phage portal protein